MAHSISDQIRELVKKGKLKEATELLSETPLSQKGILLSNRIQSLEDLDQTGQLDFEEARKEKSQIAAALVKVAKELERKDSKPLSFLSLKHLAIGIGVLLFISLGTYSLFPKEYDFVLNEGKAPNLNPKGVLKIEQEKEDEAEVTSIGRYLQKHFK